ncbi:MAG: MATE family efflux transporter [Clostridiales bacterium]|nr:MATE family efflux transporter [Clostridiales bacterium]
MQRIQLSEHFNFKKLLRFTFPSIVMTIFTSIYTIVDGVFVSNMVGDTAFAGLNLIFPFIMILGAVGLMFGSGGSALIAKTLGEGDKERANRYFSLFIIAIVVVGTVFAVVGFSVMPLVAEALGKDATRETVENGILYGRIWMCTLPFLMLQFSFQSFMITAEKPTLGFYITVSAGITNAVLDALFIAAFGWGLAGAAAATCVGQVVGGIVPVLYFARKNSSLLQLGKPRFEFKALLRACTNGSSELLINISASIIGMLYNLQLLRLAGDGGVIAYGVMMYMNMIYIGIFSGFCMGSAPIVGYHYGADNKEELKNLRRRCIAIVLIFGVVLTGFAEALASPLSALFVKDDPAVLELTKSGMRLYSLSYLLMGLNVFGSAFFTALNNGVVSAVISFSRTLCFQLGAVLLLPVFWGITGVWLAVVFAEAFAIVVTVVLLVVLRKKYGY